MASARASRSHARSEASRLGAEAFGTFLLTATACAVEVVSASHPEVGHAARAAASGLAVLAIIYAVSDVSGAHINPVVTLAFALRGAFPWRRVPGYWLAQLAGATAAAGLTRFLLGAGGALGATLPKVDAWRAVAIEAVTSLFLVSMVVHTSKRKGAVGPHAAIAVAATIAVCGFWAGPLTGASMNPARSLAPAIIGRHLHGWWIYLVGPALGALVAVVLAFAIHGPASPAEQEAAEGDA
jgi:aquaporin Z